MKIRVRRNIALPISPWWIAGAGTVVGAVGVTYAVVTLIDSLPSGVAEPARVSGVPFAKQRRALWPVITRSKERVVSYRDVRGQTHGNWARRFGAPRDGRNHAGIDIYANAGDPVRAIADGVVVRTQTFELGTDAILVEHGDIVALYGEVAPGSWRRHNVQIGSRVRRGQVIANVGCMRWAGDNCDSHMLHFETYRRGTRENARWYSGHAAPAVLLDPTRLLLIASKTA